MSIDREQTTFNGSQLKLIRIDEIQRTIITCRHTLDLTHWLYALQDFDNELESVKKKEEKIEIAEELIQLEESINKYNHIKNNPLVHNNRISAELISKLDRFYKKLIHIYHDSGLEMQLEKGALGSFGKA